MTKKLFWDNYKKWQDEAWEEFMESEFYDGEERESTEICEDGTVYLSLFSYIKNCVTSWEDSQYYTD